MATLLKADGTTMPIAGPLTLPMMQCLVGGWIEIVTIGGTHERRDILIVDEEGLLKQKPLNEPATQLYRGGARIRRHGGVIVGDAIRAVMLNAGLDNEAIE